ncbi:unnamed protein product [Allacma fusca]|uniref:Uncharacterized protein n=1 Tax=Allacma fusca TaxID=39272 RepID=A0A8J2K8S2_9HEXA|nr:unnamed protein product [Allacma fusca]
MTESAARETADCEKQLLFLKVEVASDIVRSSQATVAFQRVFYLEMLAFERTEKEIGEFIQKVDRLQSKLSSLFNDLQHAEQHLGARRASAIAEKLDTLKDSVRDLRKRSGEAKGKRKLKSDQLNEILPEINRATETTMNGDVKLVRTPSLSLFVNDQDFHLAEEISEEWGFLRKKLENYLLRYVEDITSLKVEFFGATYLSENGGQNNPDCSRSFITKISGFIQSRKSSNNSKDENDVNNKRVYSSRSESFFYCSNPTSPAKPCVDN